MDRQEFISTVEDMGFITRRLNNYVVVSTGVEGDVGPSINGQPIEVLSCPSFWIDENWSVEIAGIRQGAVEHEFDNPERVIDLIEEHT